MKNVQASFVKDGSILYELIGDRQYRQFLRYDPIAKSYDQVEQVTVGETIYIPPTDDMVSSGTIKLATYPQQFSDTLTLFEEIKYFISKFVDLPEDYLVISSLYVMLSWVFDCFEAIPYLRVIGEFGTGKSRFLKTIGSLCYRACFAGGATTVSPIFRIIEIYNGVTLVLDEADWSFSGPESEMVKILNCGYMKDVPVLRTEGEGSNRSPKSFNVYGPKILATRKHFADQALESRCLSQVMSGRPKAGIPRHLPKTFEQDAQELRNKLLSFRLENYHEMEVDLSLEDDSLDPRINQVALPVLSIIKDEKVRKAVYQSLSSIQTSLNDLKREQDPALILQALIEMIKERVKTFDYGTVNKKINELNGLSTFDRPLVSPSKMGRLNQSILLLKTRRINGVTEFEPTAANFESIQKLAARYGIQVDDVDLVDVYFGVAEEEPGNELLGEVQKALL